MTFAVRHARVHVARLLLVALVALLAVAGIGGIDATAERMLSHGAAQMLAVAQPDARTVRITAVASTDAAAQDAQVRAAIDDAFAGTPVRIARSTSTDADLVAPAGDLAIRLLDEPRLPDLAALTGGVWPVTDQEVALPDAAAERLGVRIGDTLLLTAADAPWRVVGTWQPDDATDAAWHGDPAVVSGESAGAIGPVAVSAGALDAIDGRQHVTWEIAPASHNTTDLPPLRQGIARLADLPAVIDPQRQRSMRVVGTLADTIDRQQEAVASTRGLLVAPILIITALGALVLVGTLRTVSTARATEIELLAARGASRRSLAARAAAESATFAGGGVVTALVGLAVSVGVTTTAWVSAASAVLVAAITAAFFTIRAASARPERGQRSDAGSHVLALWVPVAVAAVPAALATWQLLATDPGTGENAGTLDPLAAAAPALLLVAGCALAPVLASLLAGLLERAARRTRGIAPILPLRQIARRMGSTAVAVLCLALAASSVAFVATAPATMDAAEQRQRLAELGADVRVIAGERLPIDGATVETWTGVAGAHEVFRGSLTIGSDEVALIAGAPIAGAESRPADGGTVGAVVTRSLAARLGAEVGTDFTARLRGVAAPVRMRVDRIVDLLPGVGAGLGVAADPTALDAAGIRRAPNELWVRTEDAVATASTLRTQATEPVRILTPPMVSAAPVASAAPTLLLAGAVAAALLGLLGFIGAITPSASRREEGIVLQALGLTDHRQRVLRRGEVVGVAGYALLVGGVVGMAVAAIVLPAVLGVS